MAGFADRSAPGTGGGIEHVKDLTKLAPGVVQFLTQPWTSPFDIDLRLVTAELTASTAYGYASALGVTGDEDVEAAGGSLEGSAGGVENFWITPAGVLTIVLTDELALALHNNDASQRIIEAFVVGDRATLQLREVLPMSRPELTDNNLRMFRSATAGDVVGAGLRWGAGAAVVVRIRAGERFIGADGNVGLEGDSGRTYEPGFWSEGPDGVRRRGVGSAIAAGLPGAYLFESGLTEFEREHGQIRGLMIGLERAQAGPDWFMDARDRMENAVQATLEFNSGGNNPSRIRVTLPPNRDNSGLGARGNGWSMPITAGAATAVNGNSATRTWTIVSSPTNTYADMATAMRNAMGAGNVQLTGPGTQRFGNSGGLNFAGGVDAEDITAELDADATPPKITLVYDPNVDDLEDCRDAWDGLEIDGATILRCKELGGTDLTVRPEPVANVGRPFDQYYSEGALPGPDPQSIAVDWTKDRLRVELTPGNAVEAETPEDLVPDDGIQMVVSMSPGSLNKSNPPLNLHLTVTTPPGAFPTAETLNFGMGPEISGSIAYDPAVSVHNLQRTLSENARNNLAAALVGEHYALEVFLRDDQSRDVHRVIRNIEVVEEAPLDPKILVGTLQWDVTPASIAGVTADDLEGTYRAQFDTPYFPLTDYYFEAFIKGASGTAQSIRDRAQWVQVTHLDMAVDATEAAQIARDVISAGDKHYDVELHFFADAVALGAIAVTSRRILIGAASSDGGPEGVPDAPANDPDEVKIYGLRVPRVGDPTWTEGGTGSAVDATAREDAGRALVLANQNDDLITRLAADLATRPKYAAQMAVWPPNVAKHSGFQRNFQSTLAGLDAALATNGGATGTRFTNVFRIFTRLSDGTVVQLHTEGWAFTEDDRQTVQWNVSAAEFNAVGASAATNGVEVWGEFRAVYGGGVDELRGRTNPVFIDFGEEDEWPASRGDLKAAVEGGGGASKLPPFADIRLLPEAVPGSQVPDDFYLELAGKLTDRELDGITLLIQGQTINPHASTPVSGFDTETQALVRFDVSAVADAIANGINASDRELQVDLTFSFKDGNDFTRRILLPVNNPNAPRLVQGELDSIVFNAALTLDWLAPDMRTVTLTADVTFAFSNIQVGRPLIVEVRQSATGGNGITWPGSVEWAGGSAEGPSAAGNAVDIFTLLPLSKTRVLAAALLNVS